MAEQKKSQQMEMEAKRDRAVALDESKRNRPGAGRSATQKTQDAEDRSKKAKLLERVDRLKFASEIGLQAKSKDDHEK